jgi:hypothetical protein
VLKGHGIGRPKGDPLVMSGAFVVEGETVHAGRVSAHAGDLPSILDEVAAWFASRR